MSQAEAGPSRRRQATPADEEDFSISQSNGDGAGRRKRPRHSVRDELFAPEDQGEKIRQATEYRNLQQHADDMRVNLENIRPEDLEKFMEQTNLLFRDVKDPSIANLDARLLQTTTETAGNLIRKMKLSGASFDVDEFLLRIKGLLGLDRAEEDEIDEPDPEEEEDELEEDRVAAERRRARRGHLGDWHKIGWMAAKMYRRVPGVEFLYGPLEVEHKKRTATQRRRKKDLGPEIRLGEADITRQEEKSKDVTTSNVRNIMKALERIDPEDKGVRYLELVINPHDFAQTVENIFYTSFLIKDGRLGIEVLDDGDIIIKRREPHDPDMDGPVSRWQAIVEFDMAAWEEAIAIFNITESAIPHRAPPPTAPDANGWYGQ